VNLSDWVNKAELKATGEENVFSQKVTFFEPSMKHIPEFVNTNFYAQLKDTEVQLLTEHLAKVDEE
jgi:hypothetical protein